VVKDRSGAFTWGFLAISAACLAGLMLSVVLARMRNKALAGQRLDPPELGRQA
jgi:hypothetical protein